MLTTELETKEVKETATIIITTDQLSHLVFK